jgi:hypothetical protein
LFPNEYFLRQRCAFHGSDILPEYVDFIQYRKLAKDFQTGNARAKKMQGVRRKNIDFFLHLTFSN